MFSTKKLLAAASLAVISAAGIGAASAAPWDHGRYVVRTHDRFGRVVFVQVDPYSGAILREVIL